MADSAGFRVNQVGYFTHGSKRAVLVTGEPGPLSWVLENEAGNPLARGQTSVFGRDPGSGLGVHRVDFTHCTLPSARVRLRAADLVSPWFSLERNPLDRARKEAFRYFYLNRSGTDICLPFAGTPEQVRPAGHLPDLAVMPPEAGGGFLDVTGGWYDAGDQGKYVVNGGLSLWLLQSLWGLKLTTPWPRDLPSLEEECRWEMDFLLTMQIPAGRPFAGMVFHKVCDRNWTGLPMDPSRDPEERHLFGPTTAATLNLAACGAQGSRLWKNRDPEYARSLLGTALRAWEATLAHPHRLMAASDPQGGGGAYPDSQVEDEFYWAACELHLATGEDRFLQYLESSPHFLSSFCQPPEERSGLDRQAFDWQTLNPLGTLALAWARENPLSDRARKEIIRAGFHWLEQQESLGFPGPLEPGSYPWGSNSFVLNKGIIMACAWDFSRDDRLKDGVLGVLDYIFGCNALGLCQVTGFGTRGITQPHHRYWAQVLDPNFPPCPPGALSGGPNSEVLDPIGESLGFKDRFPAFCQVDHIMSYATNEVAINWNAPLVWLLSWAGERLG